MCFVSIKVVLHTRVPSYNSALVETLPTKILKMSGTMFGKLRRLKIYNISEIRTMST